MGPIKRIFTIFAISVLGLVIHLVVLEIFISSSEERIRRAAGQKKEARVQIKIEKKVSPQPSVKVAAGRVKQLEKKKASLPARVNIEVSKKLLDRGKKLAGRNQVRMGSFPGIAAEFQETLGWAVYKEAMERLGGTFFCLRRNKGPHRM